MRNNGQEKSVIKKNPFIIRNNLTGSILVKSTDKHFLNWHLLYLIIWQCPYIYAYVLVPLAPYGGGQVHYFFVFESQWLNVDGLLKQAHYREVCWMSLISDFGSDSLLALPYFLKTALQSKSVYHPSLPVFLPLSFLPSQRSDLNCVLLALPASLQLLSSFPSQTFLPINLLHIWSVLLLLRASGLMHKNSICLGSKKIYKTKEKKEKLM